MKITNNSPAPKAAPTTGSTGATRSNARQTSVGASDSGSVSTDSVSRLSQLEAQFSQSDFNASKVSEISAAIASGSYKVNAGAIADKLIESTAALAPKSGS